MSRPFKRCTKCGEAITREQWRRLPLVGTWDTGEEVLELRNHGCGSTLSIEVPRKDDTGRTAA